MNLTNDGVVIILITNNKTNTMKIAIVGSRGLKNSELLEKALNPYLNKISLMVSGGAKGTDKLAEIWALNNDIPTKIFLPDFKSYGRGAYRMRNLEIVNNSDLILAFWDGVSTGTKMTIELAKKAKKSINIFYI